MNKYMKETNTQDKVSWVEIENHLDQEVGWLREVIKFYTKTPSKEIKNVQSNYGYCKNCILRKIAMLISSGNVEAKVIRKATKDTKFWIENADSNGDIYHGKSWHSNKMETIRDHFTALGFDVDVEVNTLWGRSDLYISKPGHKDLIVEVGTTSAKKLFINLNRYEDTVFLLVPDDEKLVEFRT